jgi:hypothetical protein
VYDNVAWYCLIFVISIVASSLYPAVQTQVVVLAT